MNRVAIAGSAVGSLAYGACFMFRLNRRLAMGISIGSGIIAAGAAAFYSLSKRRTDTKEQRAIEKLYNQHENFSALRQNWEQVRIIKNRNISNKQRFPYKLWVNLRWQTAHASIKSSPPI